MRWGGLSYNIPRPLMPRLPQAGLTRSVGPVILNRRIIHNRSSQKNPEPGEQPGVT